MDAWGGIIGAMKTSGKGKCLVQLFETCSYRSQLTSLCTTAAVLQPYVESIFQLLNAISNDMNRSEALMRAAMGVIG